MNKFEELLSCIYGEDHNVYCVGPTIVRELQNCFDPIRFTFHKISIKGYNQLKHAN